MRGGCSRRSGRLRTRDGSLAGSPSPHPASGSRGRSRRDRSHHTRAGRGLAVPHGSPQPPGARVWSPCARVPGTRSGRSSHGRLGDRRSPSRQRARARSRGVIAGPDPLVGPGESLVQVEPADVLVSHSSPPTPGWVSCSGSSTWAMTTDGHGDGGLPVRRGLGGAARRDAGRQLPSAGTSRLAVTVPGRGMCSLLLWTG